MNGDDLESVVQSVQDRTGSRTDTEHGSGTRTALVVRCTMSGRELRDPPWPVDATWNVVSVPTLGNQVRKRCEGEAVLDSTIEHLRTRHDVTAVLVVGHTSCEVLEDAYERWVAPGSESPAGIQVRLAPLRSLVGDGFEEGILEESLPLRTVQCRLAEYNVRRQVRFLRRTLPPSVTVAGYVHDQDGAYRSFPDKGYLVALDGATDPVTIRARLPEDASTRVASVLN